MSQAGVLEPTGPSKLSILILIQYPPRRKLEKLGELEKTINMTLKLWGPNLLLLLSWRSRKNSLTMESEEEL